MEKPIDRSEFRRAWYAARHDRFAVFGIRTAIAFNASIIPVEVMIVQRPEVLRMLLFWHALGIAAALVCLLARRVLKLSMIHAHFPLATLCLIGYHQTMQHLLGMDTVLVPDMLRAWTVYLGVGTLLTMICPFGRGVPLAAGLLYGSMIVPFWLSTPGYERMSGITMLVFAGVGVFASLQNRRIVKDEEREYLAVTQASALAASKYERELELARHIQDSRAAPPRLLGRGVEVRYLQKKHDLVGGDWVALKTLSDGGVVIVVADASGKGMQAALVVHAVQSLWVDASAAQDLDPIAWLKRVNYTLCKLGENEPHAMTVGILIVRPGEACYWSAGHVPVYVIESAREGDEPAARPIVGGGDMLGLSEELKIQPVTIPLSGKARLMLGTDGVFDKGTRHKGKDLLDILAKVDERGELALDERPAEDDKSLVVVNVDAPAVQDRRPA